MNPVIKAIQERRSIRSFRPDAVSDADRDAIVQAGLFAPSARNTQGWHLTVIQDPRKIDRLTAEVKAAIIRCKVERYLPLANNPNYRVNFGTGPLFVIVSIDPAISVCPAEDTALVLGNMFLAAHSLGIGSCWINQLGPAADDPGLRALLTELGVPKGNRIFGSAVFGHPAGERPQAPARRPGTVNYV